MIGKGKKTSSGTSLIRAQHYSFILRFFSFFSVWAGTFCLVGGFWTWGVEEDFLCFFSLAGTTTGGFSSSSSSELSSEESEGAAESSELAATATTVFFFY